MKHNFSTKNLYVSHLPSSTEVGSGVFEFTDDYSVFHYGKMPDKIPRKGEAICRMTVSNLVLLAEHGIDTHFHRFISPNKLEVKLVRVLDPNSTRFDDRCRFIPLQVIYRNYLPQGSSILKRLDRGAITLQQLGLKHKPAPDEKLTQPLIEFTTKEEIDQYITEDEAKVFASLSDSQMDELKHITEQVNEIISRKAEEIGLTHADGKIEFGLKNDGSFMLVDSVGTPDENRFLYNGFHIGKQVMRDYYSYKGLAAKIQEWIDLKLPKSEWPQPPALPPEFRPILSDMYQSLCEAWIGKPVWNAPKLESVVNSLKSNIYSLIGS